MAPGKDVILYAAGFFDGEGSVQAQSELHSKGRRITCNISQNDRRPLDYLATFFGGTVLHVNLSQYNGSHRLQLSGPNARNFLRMIYPYTIVKQEEIKSAFEMANYNLETLEAA